MTEAGEDSSRGGLLGLSFKSRCPPDIQPNTRLIAVCGVTDYRGTLQDISSSEEDEPFSRGHQKGALSGLVSRSKNFVSLSRRMQRKAARKWDKLKATPGLASPREDGWFLSDFYMYQHLFRGLGK